jgi:hypothetical protein
LRDLRKKLAALLDLGIHPSWITNHSVISDFIYFILFLTQIKEPFTTSERKYKYTETNQLRPEPKRKRKRKRKRREQTKKERPSKMSTDNRGLAAEVVPGPD